MLKKTMSAGPKVTEFAVGEPTVTDVTYRVDPTVCEAYGMCIDVAGDIFDGDDWGYARSVKNGKLTPAERARAEEAYRICPVKAIRRLSGNH